MRSMIFHFGGVESFHKSKRSAQRGTVTAKITFNDFQERTISYILFWGYNSKSGTRKNIKNRHTDYVTRTKKNE